MANLSKYQENEWLQDIKDKNTYVGLISNLADEAELEGDTPLTHEITGYTGNRKEINFGAITKSGTDPSQMSGPTVITDYTNLPAPGGLTIKYFVICDADTAGNVLAWSEITSGPKVWNSGDTLRIPIDNIVVKLD